MASTPPQTEKPFHYTYLKEFRVNQCPLFLQHKCTQHRPFTCFHWHFSNQRRRRPIRRRDGTFNYSADVYCSKYDETTGICPDGDDCPYIHRNTGDTERRYHLRYYKTGTCIHETDTRGNCVKNGPHCAFAHGANDLRPPVYDIREQQSPDQPMLQIQGLSELPKTEPVNLGEKIVNDDPKWLEANYVLANYKTEVCKRPPRLCRQGYACPQYHNLKDRRRNPKKFKYRSTPCPNVKQGDDWKDPSCCEKGDSCQFCHTRTEQQFYPEIYKSTKCHDMTQTGYCPRGPFCAFAHVEQEIRMVEGNNIMQGSGDWKDMADNSSIFSPASIAQRPSPSDKVMSSSFNQVWGGFSQELSSDEMGRAIPKPPRSFNDDYNMSKSFPSCPSPLNAKPRSSSISSAKNENLYSKAPGSERSVESFMRPENGSYGSMGNNLSWPQSNKTGMGSYSSLASSPPPGNRMKQLNLLNTEAQPFYPPDETVDSVVGNALDEKESEKLRQNLTSNFWNTASAANDDPLFPMSDPVNIPREQAGLNNQDPVGIFPSASSPPHPLGFEFSGSVSSGMATGRYRTTSQTIGTPGSRPGSLLMSASLGSGIGHDLERMQKKCKQWEESWNQAKSACDAWKQEATQANKRARYSEEQSKASQDRCRMLEDNLKALLEQKEPDSGSASQCQFLHEHCSKEDLKKLSVVALQQIQSKYKSDLDTVEKVIWEFLWQPQN